MSGWSGVDTSADGSGPATLGVQGSGGLGTNLENLLTCNDIAPGSPVPYELCKEIYLYHVFGAKLTDTPIKLAMSQQRVITVGDHAEEIARAFEKTWEELDCDRYVFSVHSQARIYGQSAVVYGAANYSTNVAIPYDELGSASGLFFNVVDPLNTSGSVSTIQDPNNPYYQQYQNVSVAGIAYHESRSCVVFNEQPIYLAYSGSSFGYVGRSVYQRILFPLKSFIQTMLTDDMISQKAGVLIAKIKPPGSIADRIVAAWQGIKRTFVKVARNYNVLSIGIEESIESLNLQNVEGAATMARENIIKNISIGSGVLPKLLIDEVYVAGFGGAGWGEGSEDAKNTAHYLDGIRREMAPTYRFFDRIVMARAWNVAFFKRMQRAFPDMYGDMSYNSAFSMWADEFKATWPSLLTEPDSEKSKAQKTKFDALNEILSILLPTLDPKNKAAIIMTAIDNYNKTDMLFPIPFQIDIEELEMYLQEQNNAANPALQNV